MENCVFCRIARGEEQANRIYEDEKIVAFLDARPVNEGHTLVVSKNHYRNILDIPYEELADLFKVVKKVAVALVKSEKADGIRIVQNNGAAAHQIIFHFHVHIIPEHKEHNSHKFRVMPEQGQLEKAAARIREFM